MAALAGLGAAEAQAEGLAESVRALQALVQAAQLVVRECAIVAPRSGVVERVYYEPGEVVALGQTVARLIDPDSASVIFYLPNGDIDEAKVGSTAEVLADAYPDHPFPARVVRVGLEAEFTPRNVQTRSDRDRLVFPVEVRADKHGRKLRSGMPVTVTLRSAP